MNFQGKSIITREILIIFVLMRGLKFENQMFAKQSNPRIGLN